MAVLPSARHVLLDFDGPVCNVFSGLPAAAVAEQLLRLYEEKAGAPFALPVANRNDPLEIVRQAGELDDPLASVLDDALTEAEVRAVASSQVTPGALSVVNACRRTGRAVSAVSNNSRASVSAFLARQGVKQWFTTIVGRPADAKLMKPNPFPLLQALAHLGWEAAEAVMVGDSVTDVQAANSVGMPCVGLANKPGKRVALAEAGAAAVIDSMGELADALSAS
ncbi:HAD family hydrolase [Streptomyces orinoci]|uniref:HAD-IA family hydrolase n=1 Tax=Streptomyces orinoci TaxID=67339 RepID=A0ABV3K726_STRON|nr:HAD-IA family hydrolase [Streptomyces orinoci]